MKSSLSDGEILKKKKKNRVAIDQTICNMFPTWWTFDNRSSLSQFDKFNISLVLDLLDFFLRVDVVLLV